MTTFGQSYVILYTLLLVIKGVLEACNELSGNLKDQYLIIISA